MTLAILALQPENAPDLIILLGARVGLFLAGGSWLPANAKVIQIDVEGAEIGHGRDVDLGIICDSREALRALNRAAEGRKFPDRSQWSATLKGAQNAWKFLYKDALESDALPMHPLRLMQRDRPLPRRRRRPGGRRRRDVRLDADGRDDEQAGPFHLLRLSRLPGRRHSFRPGREDTLPGQARPRRDRRRLRRPQLRRVRHRGPPQAADRRRHQQRPGVGHGEARAGAARREGPRLRSWASSTTRKRRKASACTARWSTIPCRCVPRWSAPSLRAGRPASTSWSTPGHRRRLPRRQSRAADLAGRINRARQAEKYQHARCR